MGIYPLGFQGFGYCLFQILLGPTAIEDMVAVKQLVQQYSECPYVGLWPVVPVKDSFRTHEQGAADICIFKPLSKLTQTCLLFLAKPKSAILGTPFFTKTLASFRSLCTTLSF